MRLTRFLTVLIFLFFSTTVSASPMFSLNGGSIFNFNNSNTLGFIPSSVGDVSGIMLGSTSGNLTLNSTSDFTVAREAVDGLGGTPSAGGATATFYVNQFGAISDTGVDTRTVSSSVAPMINFGISWFDYTAIDGGFTGNFLDVFYSTPGLSLGLVQNLLGDVLAIGYHNDVPFMDITLTAGAGVLFNNTKWIKPNTGGSNQVPEPSMLPLVALGLLGFIMTRRRLPFG